MARFRTSAQAANEGAIMDQPVWKFSKAMLNHVVGDTQEDIMNKRRELERSYIGKELRKFYSKKRGCFVYRIGHTNQIISESEFATYVNRGLIVPEIRKVPEQLINTSKHVARQIVGAADTGSLPTVDPTYYSVPSATRPQPQAVRPRGAHFAPQAVPAAERVASRIPQAAPRFRQPAMATVRSTAPISEPVTPSMIAGIPDSILDREGDSVSAAEERLNQTGMMKAIRDTDFFDRNDAPKFEDFTKDDEPSGFEAAKGKVSGFFARFKRKK